MSALTSTNLTSPSKGFRVRVAVAFYQIRKTCMRNTFAALAAGKGDAHIMQHPALAAVAAAHPGKTAADVVGLGR
jgi:hypothetical protein